MAPINFEHTDYLESIHPSMSVYLPDLLTFRVKYPKLNSRLHFKNRREYFYSHNGVSGLMENDFSRIKMRIKRLLWNVHIISFLSFLIESTTFRCKKASLSFTNSQHLSGSFTNSLPPGVSESKRSYAAWFISSFVRFIFGCQLPPPSNRRRRKKYHIGALGQICPFFGSPGLLSRFEPQKV